MTTPRFIRNTPEEEAAIQRGIASDPDTFEPTDEQLTPKKPEIYRPTGAEDAEIQRGIDADPDTFIPTDEQFAQMKRRGPSEITDRSSKDALGPKLGED